MTPARVLILLPNAMAVRNILETPVLTHLAGLGGCRMVFASRDAADAAKIAGGRSGASVLGAF